MRQHPRQELACAFVFGGLEDALGRSGLHDRTVGHEDDFVGGLGGERDLVGDHDHRHAVRGKPVHHGEHLADEFGIKAEVGSSNSMSLGFIASERAIATRCC